MCHGTIVVTKVLGTDEIVGVYNPLAWDNSKRDFYLKTNDSFIFSLKNENFQNSILRRVKNGDNALYYPNNQNVYGPYIGYCEFMMRSYVSDFTQDNNVCRINGVKFSIYDYEVFKIIKKQIP
ncbi:hypothetical protein Glove_482g78 [Diversispora epigaea]|uniref:TLDc domain-containing protein n=1 Tax=Diversispora epigaea TaxID=1348612 RepID=A0A397GJJ9_9GLOM|nr:hypothetical protein Glove_482g78 [Diversispora epigaea]